MAKKSDYNFTNFNHERQNAVKIETSIGEAIVMTKPELKQMLGNLLLNELMAVAQNIAIDDRNKLEAKIHSYLNDMEKHLIDLINERLNTITEKVVSQTIGRIIDEEVNKRVSDRLNKGI